MLSCCAALGLASEHVCAICVVNLRPADPWRRTEVEPVRCSEQSVLCPAARPHGSPARELELRRRGRSRAGAAAMEEEGGGATAGAEPGPL